MLTLREVGPGDWREARDLRLEMLADTPIAFIERLEDALALSDADWEARHARRLGADSIAFVVVDQDGRWRGHMAVRFEAADEPRAWLLAVWVHPQFRGPEIGAASVMLGAVRDWLTERGLAELWLEVHEANHRAIAFYERCGFEMTGQRRPYPLDPAADELEMRLGL